VTDSFDTDYVRRCLRRDDHVTMRRLIEQLKVDPEAPAILERLYREGNREVRSWAAGVSVETVGRAALPWLVEMARRDRDAENRSQALGEILAIDPEAVRPLLPRLRSQLRDKEPIYVLDAARALSFLGDKDALPAMRAVANSWDPEHGRRKMLGTYILALEGRSDVIFERIRNHDHISLGWLAYAASALVRTPEARTVLEWGAENLPDADCRRRCSRSLSEGRWLPAAGSQPDSLESPTSA
jgi:hypothetical protein